MSKKKAALNEGVINQPDHEMIEDEFAEQVKEDEDTAAPETTKEPDFFVARSRYDMRLVVKVKETRIPLRFEMACVRITDAFAADFGVTKEEIVKAMKKEAHYGIDYIVTAGPGVVPTAAIRKFAVASAHRASERITEVQQGIRGNDMKG